MKVLLYSDIHLREERLDDIVYALTEVKEIAKAHRVKKLINAGDTFNTRGLIRTRCLKALYDVYMDYAEAGLKQTILVGNHDQEDRAGIVHPMKVFEQFDGWAVIDKPTIDSDGIAYIPYTEPKKVEEFAAKNEADTAVVHLGIRGAMMNDFRKDTDGIPVEWLSSFKSVLSGHYHFRSSFENVQYIGSLLQQNFAEMGQSKGVLIYDTKTRKAKFVEVEGTPKHYEITTHWDDGKQKWSKPSGITEKDFVRVIATGESEQISKLDQAKLHKKFKCASLKIHRNIEAKAVSRMNLGASEIYDKKGLIQKYVEFVSTGLDKKRLIKVGEGLIDADV